MNDRYQSHVKRAIRKALTVIGKRLVYLLKGVVAIEVEIDPDGYIWRSEPGEPPRKQIPPLPEPGELQASIGFRIEDDAQGIEDLIIYTTSRKASWLEFGTQFIDPRPWFFSTIKAAGDLKAQFKTLVAKFVAEPYDQIDPEDEDLDQDLDVPDSAFD